MTININKQELGVLYTKAIENYNKCIKNEDNAFLEEESSVSLKTIELKEFNIKVIVSQENTETYFLEITLGLWDKSNKIIGKYVYVEDDKGTAVDDSLVFF